VTQTDAIACPHCGAPNPPTGTFCQSCGKALPSAVPSGPRITSGEGFAGTGVGRTLQAAELEKQSKKAAGALLAVAIIQAAFGALMVFVLLPKNVPDQTRNIVMVSVFGIAAVFFALYFWARRQPLPASIVGLVLFVTMHLLDAIADPTALARGLIMKVIVIAILVNAIKAGIKYRELKRQAPGFEVGSAR
jgi:hypothetical protein